jgi:hypothetical protein
LWLASASDVLDGSSFGWFRNWTIHTETQPWHANGHRLAREQRRHRAEERATQNAARDKALHGQHEIAVAECEALWNGALPVETHPYLTELGVELGVEVPNLVALSYTVDPVTISDGVIAARIGH